MSRLYANPRSGAMSPADIETIGSDAGVYPRKVAFQELQVRPRHCQLLLDTMLQEEPGYALVLRMNGKVGIR